MYIKPQSFYSIGSNSYMRQELVIYLVVSFSKLLPDGILPLFSFLVIWKADFQQSLPNLK